MSKSDAKQSLPDFLQDVEKDSTGGWKLELTLLIRSVVSEELKNYKHECRFSLNDKEVKDVTNAITAIRFLGDGHLSSGIAVMIANHRWMRQARERSDKVSIAFIIVVASTLATGTLYAIWEGIKIFIKR